MIEQITELQAIAQSGLAYGKNPFDSQRYKRVIEIAAELLALNSNHQYDNVLELFGKDVGYATPKVDVRAAVFKNNKILLIKEKSDALWTIPGGWADVNLSPTENVIKELKEESGFDCRVKKLIGVFDNRKNKEKDKKWPHIYKMIFLCEIVSDEQFDFDKNEVLSVDFFSQIDIPALSEERINSKQIDICFKHYQELSLCAEFE